MRDPIAEVREDAADDAVGLRRNRDLVLRGQRAAHVHRAVDGFAPDRFSVDGLGRTLRVPSSAPFADPGSEQPASVAATESASRRWTGARGRRAMGSSGEAGVGPKGPFLYPATGPPVSTHPAGCFCKKRDGRDVPGERDPGVHDESPGVANAVAHLDQPVDHVRFGQLRGRNKGESVCIGESQLADEAKRSSARRPKPLATCRTAAMMRRHADSLRSKRVADFGTQPEVCLGGGAGVRVHPRPPSGR